MRNESSRAAGAGSVCTRGRWQNHCTCSTWACQTLKHAAGQFCGTQQCRASHLSVNRTQRERERDRDRDRETDRERQRQRAFVDIVCAFVKCIMCVYSLHHSFCIQ